MLSFTRRNKSSGADNLYTTFGDMVQSLSDSMTIGSTVDRLGRQTRGAIRSAYRDITSRLQWNYLLRRSQIVTVDPYSTGTVTYVASTRTMTLTGGTFPTWAASGQILLNRNVYKVERYVSSTVLILLNGRCPTGDVASATTYQLVQCEYNLPDDFAELRQIVELGRLWHVQFIPPEQMLTRTQMWFSPSDILCYTVLGNGNGRMCIQFSPPPVKSRTYDVLYQARPRPFALNSPYNTGTISTTAASTTVTLTGGVWPLSSAGSVFRVGTTIKFPEGETGDLPAAEEHLVLNRVSDTGLLLATPAVSTGSLLKYTIDDPIDLEQMSMMTLFQRMCESRLLRTHQSDMNRMNVAEAAELQALRMAMQADSRLLPKLMGGAGPNSFHDMLFGVTVSAAP